ncbi:Hypothetical protein CINCED_3A008244 [Cinara cedri]|uniref:CLIP domain-containing serine protease n=1 Tax=Cinara cedri TaxID=506608 RepID=A0A5E4MYD6_9HEMI|nr:Hypothetical protein CINCED_3A008244 [Cinara cedri]
MDRNVCNALSFWLVLFVLPPVRLQQPKPDNECLTPLHDIGVCINIKGCPLLLSLFENERDNESVVLFLKKSFCGHENRFPKVCCPLENDDIFIRTLVDDILDTPAVFSLSRENSTSSEYNRTASVSPVKLPSSDQCGRSNVTLSRIKGGINAELGALPWMAALGYRFLRQPNHIMWKCGGALITDRHVLTAAHCIEPTLVIVRLGDLDLNPSMNDGAEPISVAIEQITQHEHYSKNDITNNDIALLKLTNSISFSKFIQPICLPIMPEIRSKMLVNLVPFVAGWGVTSYRGPISTALLEVQVPILDISECKKAFSKHGVLVDDHKVICAGELGGGKDSCQGDSGSPLMWLSSNQYYLIGLVSFGFRCGEAGYPGVYTRISNYIEWIEDKLNKK